ncbi:DUF5106 domain-containing protein [Sphingobacterium griseoflavum]|uniref:Thioredoxin domain-containing protein n=1 Tax=Sphingobacterium griseoflavum TaxID=1474952 RepID=A0ABQ3HZF4_9SPHI|nr:DUF5106 domain-containing protein [Sphingobacterium griseoflavum]GHE39684.1 hypothetical protein GCM10017764_23700 [Sphingobacterium griseoflavum]
MDEKWFQTQYVNSAIKCRVVTARLRWAWHLCYAVALFLLVACHHSPSTADQAAASDSAFQDVHPAAATDMLSQYWVGYDFQDDSNRQDPEKGEQALVDFISLFGQADNQTVSSAIKRMLAAARQSPKAYDFFVAQYEKYLYNPNSPMRNDAYYEPVLEFKLDSTQLDSMERIKTATLLRLLRQNKPGTRAADFSFQLATGESARLSELSFPLTVLFFYEPGCSHCEEAIAMLRAYEPLNRRIQQKTLGFLAVYPFGDKAAWKAYQQQIPDNWLQAFDERQEVVKKGKYDLKATPTIFLLDENKNVIRKDVDVRVLMDELR